jgi:hypothetical protein
MQEGRMERCLGNRELMAALAEKDAIDRQRAALRFLDGAAGAAGEALDARGQAARQAIAAEHRRLAADSLKLGRLIRKRWGVDWADAIAIRRRAALAASGQEGGTR